MDKKKIDAFWTARTRIEDPRIATNFREDGRLSYDVNFVRRHLAPGAKILDLGAGTCTLALELLDCAKEVVAVERYAEFLAKVPDHPRLEKVCCNVTDFAPEEMFDIVLMFGVVNYLTSDEERNIYEMCHSVMGRNGVLLVKNQCGLREELIVDHYSTELKENYYARYPAIDNQKSLLSRLFDVEVIDIYPLELNRWPDTHFFAFVCRPS